MAAAAAAQTRHIEIDAQEAERASWRCREVSRVIGTTEVLSKALNMMGYIIEARRMAEMSRPTRQVGIKGQEATMAIRTRWETLRVTRAAKSMVMTPDMMENVVGRVAQRAMHAASQNDSKSDC